MILFLARSLFIFYIFSQNLRLFKAIANQHIKRILKEILIFRLPLSCDVSSSDMSTKKNLHKSPPTKHMDPGLGCDLTEEALIESNERYRSLFNSIDEGFAIVEVFFKKNGTAYDHRILDANKAFSKHTGVKNPIGKMASTLVPGGEQYFNDMYGEVVKTGKSKRFEQHSPVMGRWFDVFISRVGAASKNIIAIIFNDITKHKLAEDQMYQSEARFRAFVTASSDMMYRMSPDWSQLLELHGRNYVADTKKPTTTWLRKYIHKDDEKQVLVAIKKAIKSRGIFEIEHRFKRIDGTIGWTVSRAVPILNDKGEIIEWFGAATDVTDSKHTEDMFHVSETRYRRLFETAKDGIFILDVATRKITDANPFISELIGYSRKELVGKELWEIGFFKDKKENRAAMQELEKVGYIRYDDLPLKTKIGKQVDVEFVSNKYKENGHFVIQCNIRDITLRKGVQREMLEAKNEAQTSKENLNKLFMSAPAIIAVCRGPELVFEMANPPYRQLVGADRSLIGLPLQVAIPDIAPGLLKIIKDVAEKGIRFEAQEFPIELDWGNNGKPYNKFLNLVYEPLYDNKKKPNGLMCFGYDITEQVENRRKLEEAARAKEEFLSMASHEMRTPVTSIKGYAQVLESQFKIGGDMPSVHLASKLVEQVDNLNSLISDLFDDTKVKEGKLDLRPEYFDFNMLVRDVTEEVQHTTKQHKIISRLEGIPKIYADKQRLRQVIINMLTNAIKYSPRATHIDVATQSSERSVTLSVRDFGFGIPKEAQSKIFTRFYRVKSKQLDTYPGLGLGLYISADIVQRHGGSMEVKSRVGKGSCFTVTLPIKKRVL